MSKLFNIKVKIILIKSPQETLIREVDAELFRINGFDLDFAIHKTQQEDLDEEDNGKEIYNVIELKTASAICTYLPFEKAKERCEEIINGNKEILNKTFERYKDKLNKLGIIYPLNNI